MVESSVCMKKPMATSQSRARGDRGRLAWSGVAMFECAGGGLAERTPSGAMGPLKRLGGAALDVFEHEPQVPPQFFALDNVVLVPHIASATVQTRQAMAQRVLDNLDAFVAGQPMPSAVQAP
ncbi:MAG: hypothetical protein KBE90_07610 [Ottowia sp.]|nr:hypothetical protein [Ottowia sp.]